MATIKTHVKKGDLVTVVTGDRSREGDEARKNRRGKTGKVLSVNPKKGQVIVEGVNFIRKTTKATQNSQGGIVEREGPIHISNVRLAEVPAKEVKKPAAKKAAKKRAKSAE